MKKGGEVLKYLFNTRSRGSAVERRIHIAKADGSNPSDSTLEKQAPLFSSISRRDLLGPGRYCGIILVCRLVAEGQSDGEEQGDDSRKEHHRSQNNHHG